MRRISCYTAPTLLALMMISSVASAVPCPAQQTFHGLLLPTQTITYTITTSTTQPLAFVFYPDSVLASSGQTIEFRVIFPGGGGCLFTGTTAMGCSFGSASAGTYTMQVRGKFLDDASGHALQGLAFIPFHVDVVGTSVCSP